MAFPETKLQATLEEAARLADVVRQQLVADISQRLQAARDLVSRRATRGCAHHLFAWPQTVARSAADVPESVRNDLDRRIQSQILSTVRAEERIVQERAEQLRREASAGQRIRRARPGRTQSGDRQRDDDPVRQPDGSGTSNILDNGGLGDITTATAPFYERGYWPSGRVPWSRTTRPRALA